MQTSIFLARLLGPALLFFGAGVLLNQAYYRTMIREVVASKSPFFLLAMVGLIGGLAIVLVHNVWTLNWRVLITILGWVNFLRGVVTVLFPAQTTAFAERHIANNKYVPLIPASVALVVGLILTFFGYF